MGKIHGTYFTTLIALAFISGLVYGLLKWVSVLIDWGYKGNVAMVIIYLIFSELLVPMYGLIFGVEVFLVILFISILPYLIVRGMIKK